MCSSTLSDTANRLRHGSTLCSPTVEKILCRTPFRSGHMSAICARLRSKGKVGVQRGRETAGVPSFLPPPWVRRAPAAGAAILPPSADGESPAEVQRKTPRPSGANPPAAVRVPRSADAAKGAARQGRTRLRQFVCPGQPVQQKEPPVRGEPACGSSCAPFSRCRKGAARQGRTRLRQFVCPGHLVPRIEKHRRIASTVLKVCTFTQIAAAYRHPYAPAPAGPVPDDRAR